MLTVTYARRQIKAPYAECRYAECRYAERRCAECHGVQIVHYETSYITLFIAGNESRER
jgi:hypothetical protein